MNQATIDRIESLCQRGKDRIDKQRIGPVRSIYVQASPPDDAYHFSWPGNEQKAED